MHLVFSVNLGHAALQPAIASLCWSQKSFGQTAGRWTYALVHPDAVAPNTVIRVLKHILGFEGQPFAGDSRARAKSSLMGIRKH